MKKIIWILTLGLSMASTLQAQEMNNLTKRSYKQGDRISIIGAGATGLAIARTLVNEGVPPQNITVIEKESEAGGKVKSIKAEGRTYELGAVILVPGVYDTLIKLADTHHLKLRPNPASPGNYNLQSGQLEPLNLSDPDKAALMETMGRYAKAYQEKYRVVSEPKGFGKIPADLDVPWMDFVKANKFEWIHRMAANFIGGSGYLHPNSLPTAAQILRMLTPYALSQLMKYGTESFSDEGFQELWKLEAQDLQKTGVHFQYETSVKIISRLQTTTKVILSNNQTLEVEHVFYTGNLAYLPMLLDQPTALEKDTYSRIKFNDYRSLILKVDGLPGTGLQGAFGYFPNNFTIPMNRPVLSSKPYTDSNIEIFYAYAAEGATDDAVLKGISDDLAIFGGKVSQVIATQKWDYFPHVSSDIKGFFNNVMSLEGLGGVWIAGEATSFTATIQVYEQGRDFAQMFVKNEL